MPVASSDPAFRLALRLASMSVFPPGVVLLLSGICCRTFKYWRFFSSPTKLGIVLAGARRLPLSRLLLRGLYFLMGSFGGRPEASSMWLHCFELQPPETCNSVYKFIAPLLNLLL